MKVHFLGSQAPAQESLQLSLLAAAILAILRGYHGRVLAFSPMVSLVKNAGTTPSEMLYDPRLGLKPKIPFAIAGALQDPEAKGRFFF